MPRSDRLKIAIACQGGGSHAAFAAGILIELFQPRHAERIELVGLSGTSGGAVCAALAWSGLIRAGGGPVSAAEALVAFWQDLSARGPFDVAVNSWAMSWARFPIAWEISPYLVKGPAEPRLRSLLEKHVKLEDLPRNEADRKPPELFIGSTDIQNGGGVVFTSRDLTYDDIIASAAVPPLYRAVRTRGTLYWDGLFSRNPPVREFTDLKPDEIWVIRINPLKCAEEPTLMPEIVDRRNELSGNISLDQELFFIRKINELLAEFPTMQQRYKHIRIREIELDLDLDYPSKLDRGASHIQRLIETGRKAAPLFFRETSTARFQVTPLAEPVGAPA